MTFEDKFARCVQNLNNIDKPDYTEFELNYYADFVELIALFEKQDGVTFGDIQDRFFGEKYYENAEKKDLDEAFLDRIFGMIEERINLYKIDYPFQYQNNEILILKQNLTFKNKLYLSLLVSSKLNIFNPFQVDITTDFEKISYVVLKKFLPENAIIKEFGENTAYNGNAVAKIKQLANELDLLINDYELNQVSERNTQERGLDIVGWLSFADKCGNKVVFLCQCACGKQFESKQHDTRRFENYLQFYKTNPQHTMFIPYSLINVRENKFYHSDYIERDYLIFERKRIIEYHNDTSFENSESFKIVKRIIGT
ncbi:MAG: hypothetical protein LBR26_10220 [Prevotella sp.]|nr:hypothetical protein [Prevotella sp.]